MVLKVQRGDDGLSWEGGPLAVGRAVSWPQGLTSLAFSPSTGQSGRHGSTRSDGPALPPCPVPPSTTEWPPRRVRPAPATPHAGLFWPDSGPSGARDDPVHTSTDPPRAAWHRGQHTAYCWGPDSAGKGPPTPGPEGWRGDPVGGGAGPTAGSSPQGRHSQPCSSPSSETKHLLVAPARPGTVGRGDGGVAMTPPPAALGFLSRRQPNCHLICEMEHVLSCQGSVNGK